MSDKYLKKVYKRISANEDGYNLEDFEIVTEQGEKTETKIYYYVYEDDFFEKFPKRCNLALEKGSLSDEDYKEQCEQIGVISTTPTNTVAEEITEKTVYIPYSDEEQAKAEAEALLYADVSLEDFKEYARKTSKRIFNEKNKKTAFKTKSGVIIDYGMEYIDRLRNLIAITEENEAVDFRCYDNLIVITDKAQLEKWLAEMITHSVVLINLKWQIETMIDRATTFSEIKDVFYSMGSLYGYNDRDNSN